MKSIYDAEVRAVLRQRRHVPGGKIAKRVGNRLAWIF
jgi:hypothetical protein